MNSKHTLVFSLLLIALLAYSLPWIINPATGLSLGADDLAEWTSILPQVRATNPPLFVTLLLRLPLVSISICAAFSSTTQATKTIYWWLNALIIAVLFLFSLPPLEFFTSARSDINYQQQFILAVVMLGISGIGLLGAGGAMRPTVVILAAIAGIISSILGLERANQFMLELVLPAQRGLGAVLLSSIFLIFILTKIKDSYDFAALFR